MSGLSSAAQALATVQAFESGNDIRQIVSCSEGGRAFRLLKRREDTKRKAEEAKTEIENETNKRKMIAIDKKFSGSKADQLEEEFKKTTIGLMSAEEFAAKRKSIDEQIEEIRKNAKGKTLRLARKVNSNKLSFGSDAEEDDEDGSDDEGGDSNAAMRKSFGKDPSANTSFLFDADREEDLLRRKQALIKEYNETQAQSKVEKLEVTYSYWDGSGHRRTTTLEKGFTIGRFLAKCKAELEKADFPELRAVSVDNLMYIKEDLIIPANVSFYDLIKNKARGKSGPLFNFDVHDDIRLRGDVRVEKDDSHAGKIVDRKWYERNKHIFPACRWEMYSKDKTYNEYTITGDNDLSGPLRSTLRG